MSASWHEHMDEQLIKGAMCYAGADLRQYAYERLKTDEGLHEEIKALKDKFGSAWQVQVERERSLKAENKSLKGREENYIKADFAKEAEIEELKKKVDYCEGIMEEDEDLEERHKVDMSDLKVENKDYFMEIKALKAENDKLKEAQMKLDREMNDMIWDVLYQYGFINKNPLAPITDHIKILIDQVKSLEAEKEGRNHDVQQFQQTLSEKLELESEVEELKEENKELQEAIPCFRIVHKHLGDPPEVIRLKEENKKLKAELEEKEEEVSLINSEEMENESVIQKLIETIRELLPNDPHEADKYIDIAHGH